MIPLERSHLFSIERRSSKQKQQSAYILASTSLSTEAQYIFQVRNYRALSPLRRVLRQQQQQQWVAQWPRARAREREKERTCSVSVFSTCVCVLQDNATAAAAAVCPRKAIIFASERERESATCQNCLEMPVCYWDSAPKLIGCDCYCPEERERTKRVRAEVLFGCASVWHDDVIYTATYAFKGSLGFWIVSCWCFDVYFVECLCELMI